MSPDECYAQAYPSCVPEEEQGEWVWVPKKITTAAIPGFPVASIPSPMYRSETANGHQSAAPTIPWCASPITPTCSPLSGNLPGVLIASPVEPLLEEFNIDMALPPDAILDDFQEPWLAAGPDAFAIADHLFSSGVDADLHAGLDFKLASGMENPSTPPGMVSPTSSVFAAWDFNTPSALLEPMNPASSVLAATPSDCASSVAAASLLPAPPSQSLPCPEPSCTKVFSNTSNLRRHERRRHRRPFRCPLCGKGHLDKRALARHLWAKHPAYAAQHGVRSERARCPRCEYEGRADNVARHMKTHAW